MADQPAHRAAVVEFDHVTKRYDAPAKRKDRTIAPTPGAVNDLSLTVPAGKICVLVGPSGLRQDDVAQDGQPAHRADERPHPHRRRGRRDARRDRAAAEHRLRHPAGRPLPAPDDRRERGHRAAAPGLDEGASAGARGRAARARRPGPRQVPRPLPEPAVRRRAPARRRRPGARGRPADHAHGRAVRGRRPDRPRPPPERVPAPPGGARQDDPVRDPRHRRGDQDGRPGRGLPGRRHASPSSARRPRSWPNPASEFVARFVGADRGLKRLSLSRVGDLELVAARHRRARRRCRGTPARAPHADAVRLPAPRGRRREPHRLGGRGRHPDERRRSMPAMANPSRRRSTSGRRSRTRSR